MVAPILSDWWSAFVLFIGMNLGLQGALAGLAGWLFFIPCDAAFGQVLSLTLAFEVNSPYGLSEPWFTLRNSLLRHPEIESVDERPDRKARTGTITTKSGKLLDLEELAQAVRDSGAGATLRDVKAIAQGRISIKDAQFYLKMPDAEIALQPPIEAAERAAYERLLNESGRSIRISGPLKQERAGESRKFSLEVRGVEIIPKNSTP